MELNQITLELLRDEAYVLLCREAITEQMKDQNRDKPPPQPVPALRQYPAQMRATQSAAPVSSLEANVALYSRLHRIGRLETWIQQRLRAELALHLEATSPTYLAGMRIQQALSEWEFCVRHVLPDSLAEFARELRGIRQLAAGPHRRNLGSTAPEFIALRRIASRVEEQQLQIGRIASTVAGHAQQGGTTDVSPPPLPNFRRIVWVDWIAEVSVDQLLAEVTRVESEVRTFLNQGLPAVLERMQACRNACSTRQESILEQYWKRLREHAQAHYVEERELDTVLDALTLRHETEIARREGIRHRPFVET